MKAVLLAGGRGERLAPLTDTVPKPLVRVLDVPVIEYAFAALKKLGIKSAAVTTCYRAEELSRVLGEVVHGVSVQYFQEETPLGTAGAVRACAPFLDEDFLVLSADALFDFDLEDAIRFHREKNALATLVLTERDDVSEYGLVKCSPEGKILGFSEKPSWQGVFSNLVNCGIYVFSREVLGHIPEGVVDFSSDLFPQLLAEKGGLYGVALEGFWCDIGSPESLYECNMAALHDRVRLSIPARGRILGSGAGKSFLGEGAVLCSPARVQSSVLGAGCRVYAATVQNSVIGRACRIEEGASVSDALLADRVACESSSFVSPLSVLGEGVRLRASARTEEGQRVSAGAVVEKHEAANAFSKDDIRTGSFSASGDTEKIADRFSLLGRALATKGQFLLCSGKGELSRFAAEALCLGAVGAGARILRATAHTLAQARRFAAEQALFCVYVKGSEETLYAEAVLLDENGLLPVQKSLQKAQRALTQKSKSDALGSVREMGDAFSRAYCTRLSLETQPLCGVKLSLSGDGAADLLSEVLSASGATVCRTEEEHALALEVCESRGLLNVSFDGRAITDLEHLRAAVIAERIRGRRTLYPLSVLPRQLSETLAEAGVKIVYPEVCLPTCGEEAVRRAAREDFDLSDLTSLSLFLFSDLAEPTAEAVLGKLERALSALKPFAMYSGEYVFDKQLSARLFSHLWDQIDQEESGLCLHHASGGVSHLYPALGRVRILSEGTSAEAAEEFFALTRERLEETLNTLNSIRRTK